MGLAAAAAALCFTGTLLVLASASLDGHLQVGLYPPCSTTLLPVGPCEPDGDGCRFVFNLPPVTVHFPKPLMDLERLVEELQTLKDNVDELRRICKDCGAGRGETACTWGDAEGHASDLDTNTQKQQGNNEGCNDGKTLEQVVAPGENRREVDGDQTEGDGAVEEAADKQDSRPGNSPMQKSTYGKSDPKIWHKTESKNQTGAADEKESRRAALAENEDTKSDPKIWHKTESKNQTGAADEKESRRAALDENDDAKGEQIKLQEHAGERAKSSSDRNIWQDKHHTASHEERPEKKIGDTEKNTKQPTANDRPVWHDKTHVDMNQMETGRGSEERGEKNSDAQSGSHVDETMETSSAERIKLSSQPGGADGHFRKDQSEMSRKNEDVKDSGERFGQSENRNLMEGTDLLPGSEANVVNSAPSHRFIDLDQAATLTSPPAFTASLWTTAVGEGQERRVNGESGIKEQLGVDVRLGKGHGTGEVGGETNVDQTERPVLESSEEKAHLGKTKEGTDSTADFRTLKPVKENIKEPPTQSSVKGKGPNNERTNLNAKGRKPSTIPVSKVNSTSNTNRNYSKNVTQREPKPRQRFPSQTSHGKYKYVNVSAVTKDDARTINPSANSSFIANVQITTGLKQESKNQTSKPRLGQDFGKANKKPTSNYNKMDSKKRNIDTPTSSPKGSKLKDILHRHDKESRNVFQNNQNRKLSNSTHRKVDTRLSKITVPSRTVAPDETATDSSMNLTDTRSFSKDVTQQHLQTNYEEASQGDPSVKDPPNLYIQSAGPSAGNETNQETLGFNPSNKFKIPAEGASVSTPTTSGSQRNTNMGEERPHHEQPVTKFAEKEKEEASQGSSGEKFHPKKHAESAGGSAEDETISAPTVTHSYTATVLTKGDPNTQKGSPSQRKQTESEHSVDKYSGTHATDEDEDLQTETLHFNPSKKLPIQPIVDTRVSTPTASGSQRNVKNGDEKPHQGQPTNVYEKDNEEESQDEQSAGASSEDETKTLNEFPIQPTKGSRVSMPTASGSHYNKHLNNKDKKPHHGQSQTHIYEKENEEAFQGNVGEKIPPKKYVESAGASSKDEAISAPPESPSHAATALTKGDQNTQKGLPSQKNHVESELVLLAEDRIIHTMDEDVTTLHPTLSSSQITKTSEKEQIARKPKIDKNNNDLRFNPSNTSPVEPIEGSRVFTPTQSGSHYNIHLNNGGKNPPPHRQPQTNLNEKDNKEASQGNSEENFHPKKYVESAGGSSEDETISVPPEPHSHAATVLTKGDQNTQKGSPSHKDADIETQTFHFNPSNKFPIQPTKTSRFSTTTSSGPQYNRKWNNGDEKPHYGELPTNFVEKENEESSQGNIDKKDVQSAGGKDTTVRIKGDQNTQKGYPAQRKHKESDRVQLTEDGIIHSTDEDVTTLHPTLSSSHINKDSEEEKIARRPTSNKNNEDLRFKPSNKFPIQPTEGSRVSTPTASGSQRHTNNGDKKPHHGQTLTKMYEKKKEEASQGNSGEKFHPKKHVESAGGSAEDETISASTESHSHAATAQTKEDQNKQKGSPSEKNHEESERVQLAQDRIIHSTDEDATTLYPTLSSHITKDFEEEKIARKPTSNKNNKDVQFKPSNKLPIQPKRDSTSTASESQRNTNNGDKKTHPGKTLTNIYEKETEEAPQVNPGEKFHSSQNVESAGAKDKPISTPKVSHSHAATILPKGETNTQKGSPSHEDGNLETETTFPIQPTKGSRVSTPTASGSRRTLNNEDEKPLYGQPKNVQENKNKDKDIPSDKFYPGRYEISTGISISAPTVSTSHTATGQTKGHQNSQKGSPSQRKHVESEHSVVKGSSTHATDEDADLETETLQFNPSKKLQNQPIVDTSVSTPTASGLQRNVKAGDEKPHHGQPTNVYEKANEEESQDNLGEKFHPSQQEKSAGAGAKDETNSSTMSHSHTATVTRGDQNTQKTSPSQRKHIESEHSVTKGGSKHSTDKDPDVETETSQFYPSKKLPIQPTKGPSVSTSKASASHYNKNLNNGDKKPHHGQPPTNFFEASGSQRNVKTGDKKQHHGQPTHVHEKVNEEASQDNLGEKFHPGKHEQPTGASSKDDIISAPTESHSHSATLLTKGDENTQKGSPSQEDADLERETFHFSPSNKYPIQPKKDSGSHDNSKLNSGDETPHHGQPPNSSAEKDNEETSQVNSGLKYHPSQHEPSTGVNTNDKTISSPTDSTSHDGTALTKGDLNAQKGSLSQRKHVESERVQLAKDIITHTMDEDTTPLYPTLLSKAFEKEQISRKPTRENNKDLRFNPSNEFSVQPTEGSSVSTPTASGSLRISPNGEEKSYHGQPLTNIYEKENEEAPQSPGDKYHPNLNIGSVGAGAKDETISAPSETHSHAASVLTKGEENIQKGSPSQRKHIQSERVQLAKDIITHTMDEDTTPLYPTLLSKAFEKEQISRKPTRENNKDLRFNPSNEFSVQPTEGSSVSTPTASGSLRISPNGEEKSYHGQPLTNIYEKENEEAPQSPGDKYHPNLNIGSVGAGAKDETISAPSETHSHAASVLTKGEENIQKGSPSQRKHIQSERVQLAEDRTTQTMEDVVTTLYPTLSSSHGTKPFENEQTAGKPPREKTNKDLHFNPLNKLPIQPTKGSSISLTTGFGSDHNKNVDDGDEKPNHGQPSTNDSEMERKDKDNPGKTFHPSSNIESDGASTKDKPSPTVSYSHTATVSTKGNQKTKKLSPSHEDADRETETLRFNPTNKLTIEPTKTSSFSTTTAFGSDYNKKINNGEEKPHHGQPSTNSSNNNANDLKMSRIGTQPTSRFVEDTTTSPSILKQDSRFKVVITPKTFTSHQKFSTTTSPSMTGNKRISDSKNTPNERLKAGSGMTPEDKSKVKNPENDRKLDHSPSPDSQVKHEQRQKHPKVTPGKVQSPHKPHQSTLKENKAEELKPRPPTQTPTVTGLETEKSQRPNAKSVDGGNPDPLEETHWSDKENDKLRKEDGRENIGNVSLPNNRSDFNRTGQKIVQEKVKKNPKETLKVPKTEKPKPQTPKVKPKPETSQKVKPEKTPKDKIPKVNKFTDLKNGTKVLPGTKQPNKTKTIPAKKTKPPLKTKEIFPKTVTRPPPGPETDPLRQTVTDVSTINPKSRITPDERPQTAHPTPSIALTTKTNRGPSAPTPSGGLSVSSQGPRVQLRPTARLVIRSTVAPGSQGLKDTAVESTTPSARELRVKINQVTAFLNKSSLQPAPGRPLDTVDGEAKKDDDNTDGTTDVPTVRDCSDHRLSGHSISGVYLVTPDPRANAVPVLCDMAVDGGGWTVLQRRLDGSVSFNRSWAEYRDGFGDLDGEFWLGNHLLHLLTQDRSMELRVELEDFDGTRQHAHYQLFKVASERMRFRLSVGGYSGTAGDALCFSSQYNHNNRAFTTPDRDNDRYPSGNCGAYYSSGWWFDACMAANLNGRYYRGRYKGVRDGIYWGTWHNISSEYYPTNERLAFKTVTMMFRPRGFTP